MKVEKSGDYHWCISAESDLSSKTFRPRRFYRCFKWHRRCRRQKPRASSRGISAEYAGFDVTNEDAVNSNIQAIGEKYGKIDVLVNNAGETEEDVSVLKK